MQYGNTISSSSVHHNGLTGIELHDSSDNSLQSVEVHNNGASGVSVNHETGLTILGSDILANGLDGVFDLDGVNTVVDGGTISDNIRDGVHAVGSQTNLAITNNTIGNNGGAGIHLQVGLDQAGGSNTTVDGNLLGGNGEDGVLAFAETNLQITDNVIEDSALAGIAVDGGISTTIDHNTIQRSGTSGITAADEQSPEITGNSIGGNGQDGVRLARGSDATVDDNEVFANGADAIDTDSVFGLRITNNSIHDNATLGIDVEDGNGTVLAENEVQSNGGAGISVLREVSLAISHNDIHDNAEDGIQLAAGTNSTVSGNTVSDNGTVAGDYGIQAEQETNLVLTKNTFARNFDAHIFINSSDDVFIRRNDLNVSTDGIVLVKTFAHPLDVVIGGSSSERNRFRGLPPTSNQCDAAGDSCYIQLGNVILPPFNAQYNDWGTTDLGQIENLVCHDNEFGCGLTVVDFSNPEPPGDSPAVKATPTPTPTGPLGDVSCDGTVNSIDAALLLQFGAGLVSSLACQANADVNGDGMITSIDAALVLQFSAGLIPTLPF